MIKLNGEEIKFETFPNGETRMVEKDIVKYAKYDKEIGVHFKYENDSDLIKLMFLKKYLDFHIRTAVNLMIHYMPYSRMDRSEGKSAFTLKYVSDFINSLKFNKVIVIEPHSDVTVALLENAKPLYINFTLLPSVMEEVGFDKDNDYLFFPDAGAQKRYSKVRGFKQLVGFKDRDFKTGEIKSLHLVGDKRDITNTSSPKVIILDDLSSYGGTFVHSEKLLRSVGFKEVYLLVAHAENSIFKGELFNHVDKVFTTNSILTEQNYPINKKYEPQLKIYDIREVLLQNV